MHLRTPRAAATTAMSDEKRTMGNGPRRNSMRRLWSELGEARAR